MEPLWTEKYRPKRSEGVVGHAAEKLEIAEWLRGGAPGWCLLWGPAGVGKTTLAVAVCNDAGYECIIYNAAEIDLARDLSLTNHVSIATGKKTAILIDEADSLQTYTQLLACLNRRGRKPPVFLTANSVAPALRGLGICCFLNYPPAETVVELLKGICEAERMDLATESLEEIVKLAGRDIRQSITLLQYNWRQVAPPTPDVATILRRLQALPAAERHPELIQHREGNIWSMVFQASCPPEVLRAYLTSEGDPWATLDALALSAKTYFNPWNQLSQWGNWTKHRK